jgi:hypothetical protein
VKLRKKEKREDVKKRRAESGVPTFSLYLKKSMGTAPNGSWKQKDHRDPVPIIFLFAKTFGTRSLSFFCTEKSSGPGP